jgi:polyisoprenoid-binding protein YceI
VPSTKEHVHDYHPRGHTHRRLHHRCGSQPRRVHRPARHGHQGPRPVQRHRGQRPPDFENPSASTAELIIQVASIDTRNEQRDGHLRTNDFFDAPNYPQIIFRSTSAEKLDDERFRLTGDLSIKETTKPVTIDFEYAGHAKDPFGNIRLGFDGSTTINRRDWDVTWNAPLETGGVLVSDKVTLELEISAVQTLPAA